MQNYVLTYNRLQSVQLDLENSLFVPAYIIIGILVRTVAYDVSYSLVSKLTTNKVFNQSVNFSTSGTFFLDYA